MAVRAVEAAGFGGEGGLRRLAVAEAVVEGVHGRQHRRAAGQFAQLVDAGQALRMTAGEKRIAKDQLRPGDPAPKLTPSAGSAAPVLPVSKPPPDPAAPAKPLPPGADTTTGGGGRVGLLLISPFVKAGSTNAISSYNHYSLLRSIEDLFGLQPTGYAGYPGVLAFDKVIYNAPATSS